MTTITVSNNEKIPASYVATNTGAIYYKDATELAALIRTKQLSSREVVQAHLDRIDAVNPQINAVVTLMANNALKSADDADKAVAEGAALGPLHGVSLSIVRGRIVRVRKVRPGIRAGCRPQIELGQP